jgi:hypothetical protein
LLISKLLIEEKASKMLKKELKTGDEQMTEEPDTGSGKVEGKGSEFIGSVFLD